ncbi:hypothetical protein E2562_012565 [Oryza meyeriana var. granulata]|uniref:RING-type domain-containing protein n=1 Tax=Oryza meyeriana var. granulata TaxID=110450 RepID=A0A6G1D2V1_9ORYZ|nr:hypothetical protein E2562_012565 [Oryza meyeriana var. granulata]
MAVEARISIADLSYKMVPEHKAGDLTTCSSVHIRCKVTVKYASRRLRGNGKPVRDRQPDKSWTTDESRPVPDHSIFLRYEDTRRALQEMLASMPRLRDLDLSPDNWEAEPAAERAAGTLHRFARGENEQGRWTGARYRFEVHLSLEVTLVFSEPRALVGACVEGTMQTVAPGSDEACGICLEEFSKGRGSDPVNLPCEHAFHAHCVLACFYKGNTCPVCRHDLSGLVAAPWTKLAA